MSEATPPPWPDHAWMFDDPDGTTLSPFLGQAEGLLMGDTHFDDDAPFPESGSVVFDGKHDIIDIPGLSGCFNGLHQFSLSFWIQSTETNTTRGWWEALDNGRFPLWGIGYDGRIYSPPQASNTIQAAIHFEDSRSPFYPTGIHRYNSTSNLQTTHWQHVLMTWRNGSGFNLYVNGQSDQPTRDMAKKTGRPAMMDRFVLGDGPGGYWLGKISETALWTNETLRAEHAAWLYQNSIRNLLNIPRITNIQPEWGMDYHPPEAGIRFQALAKDQTQIAADDILLELNGKDVTSDLQITGDPQNRFIVFPNLAGQQIYTGTIRVTDSLGGKNRARLSFNTFNLDKGIVIEPDNEEESWIFSTTFDAANYAVYLNAAASHPQFTELAFVTGDSPSKEANIMRLGKFPILQGPSQFVPLVDLNDVEKRLVLTLDGLHTFQFSALESAEDSELNFLFFVPKEELPSLLGPLLENHLPTSNSQDAAQTPLIGGTIKNRLTKLDPNSVQLLVDDRDVSEQIEVSHSPPISEIKYRSDTRFQPGSRHHVELRFLDGQDNSFAEKWEFNVSSDSDPPLLLGAQGMTDIRSSVIVRVQFSEPVDSDSALNPDNYSFDPPIAKDIFEMLPMRDAIRIFTRIPNSVDFLTLTVHSVRDVPGNAIPSAQTEIYLADFQQKPGPLGLVVVEAENFQGIITTDNPWVFTSEPPNFSGWGAMTVIPDQNNHASDYIFLDTPELVYNVRFEQGGKYIVWIRGAGKSFRNNSVRLIVKDYLQSTHTQVFGFANELNGWTWTNPRGAQGQPLTMTINGPGRHSIHLLRDDDGVHVDKLLFTLDPKYHPQDVANGLGPVESPRVQTSP